MFATLLSQVIQNNSHLIDYNDSRNYVHQSSDTESIPVSGTYTVGLSNLNGTQEVLLVVMSDNEVDLTIVDTNNSVNATIKVNRLFVCTLKGLTGLTFTNPSSTIIPNISYFVGSTI